MTHSVQPFYIFGNWKMNTTLADAVVMTKLIQKGVEELDDIIVGLFPPFPWLYPIKELLSHSGHHLRLGAQTISQFEAGAYTGEVGASMLKSLVEYVLIGHSERVQHFHEKPIELRQKIRQVIRQRLKPLVAVGELKLSQTSSYYVVEKLKLLLQGFSLEELKDLIVVYEPVWAISTTRAGRAADPLYVRKVVDLIRQALPPATPILYGGSVDEHNIVTYLRESTVEGALVGSASLKAKVFIRICELAEEIKKEEHYELIKRRG